LILLDILMPDMDGYETCKHLKADDATKAIPIVFMSALTETFDKIKGFRLGAVDYIIKPIEIDELLARVNTHIQINRLQKILHNVNLSLEEKVVKRTRELKETNERLREEIAERKQIEAAFRERAVRLELVHHIAKKTIAILEVDELLHQVVYLIQDRFQYHNVAIFLVDGENVVLKASAMKSYQKLEGKFHLKVGKEGISGWVAKQDKPYCSGDVRKDERFLALTTKTKVRSEAAVPIHLKGRVLGVLDVQCNSLDAFSDIDIYTIQTIADQLAVVIINAQLFESRQRELVEKKQAEKQLAIFHLLAESSGQGICIADLDKKTIYMNPTLLRLLGKKNTETIGSPFTDYYPLDAQERMSMEIIPKVLKDGQWKGESLLAIKDYETIPIIENMFLIRDHKGTHLGFADMVTDITERKLVEETLRESEEKYRYLVEWANDGILIIRDDRIIFGNRAAANIIGLSVEALSGTKLEAFLSKRELKEIGKNYIRYRKDLKIPTVFELQHLGENGKNIDVEISMGDIHYEGEEAFLVFIRDITTRKKAQEASLLAERANRFASLSTLTAGISHEINQPLTALKVEVDGLLYWKDKHPQKLPESLVESLLFISSEADKINQIIQHMRSLIKPQQTESRELMLNQAIQDALTLIDQRLKSHGIKLVLDLDTLCPVILGQKTAVEQIMVNLVSNAIRAFDRVDRPDKKIAIITRASGDKCIIKVIDNGPGIQEEQLSKIFDPFFTTSMNEECQGLGLAIVQNLVNVMGGTIATSNNEESGACFTIIFPICVAVER
jgi:PAS domain S-box-containing protein